MDNLTLPQIFAVWALPILFAITVHEAAHGFVANKLGDDTAKMLGRVTLNPLKHISWVGTVLLPTIMLLTSGFVFGWAKPVPVNWNRLRHTKRDIALVALAGPAANFLMMLIWAAIAKGGLYLLALKYDWAKAIVYMGLAGININLILMILNLIPIPPLDGSRALYSVLPRSLGDSFLKLEYIGLAILLALVLSGLLTPVIAIPSGYIKGWVLNLFGI